MGAQQPDGNEPASSSGDPKTALTVVSRRTMWGMATLLLLPWLFVIFSMGPQWFQRCAAGWRALTDGSTGKLHHCKPGPWGNLEYIRIAIEPPETFVAVSFNPEKPIRWFLRGYTAERLTALWKDAGLTDTQQRELMATATWDAPSGGVTLTPPRELMLNLQPQARARIYQALGEFAENPLQVHPFRFRTDVIDEWLTNSPISSRTEELIRKMLYRQGASTLFADQDLLLALLETPKERALAIKTLSRMSTVLMRLRVMPDSDIDDLAKYWGRGRRAKDIRALLTSLPKTPEGYTIDVGHLLPMFARKLLYTYPNPDTDPTTSRQDCHWTSMNFFNENADNLFLSLDHIRQVVEKDYYPVLGEPTMGDIIFFLTPKGEAIHSCIYIADNIVFTKNGPEPYVPWMLADLADVRALYSVGLQLETRVYRHKQW